MLFVVIVVNMLTFDFSSFWFVLTHCVGGEAVLQSCQVNQIQSRHSQRIFVFAFHGDAKDGMAVQRLCVHAGGSN